MAEYDLCQARDGVAAVEAVCGDPLCFRTHSSTLCAVGENLPECACERVVVIRLNQQPPTPDYLGETPDAGRDHRDTGHHWLQRGQPEGFSPQGRDNRNIRVGDKAASVRMITGEDHSVLVRKTAMDAPNLVHVRAVAEVDERGTCDPISTAH